MPDAADGVSVSAFVATAFAQDDAEKASRQWRLVADQLRPKVPKLAALMDEAEHDVLATMSFPQQHRTKLHSTNPARTFERRNQATHRRSSASSPMKRLSPVSSARSFSNRTDEWSVQRARYISLETIAAMGDNEPVSLPVLGD